MQLRPVYDGGEFPFIDCEAYGQKQINAETGVFNEQGYVAYKGLWSLSELMVRPPTEQRHAGPEMRMGGFFKMTPRVLVRRNHLKNIHTRLPSSNKKIREEAARLDAINEDKTLP